MIKLTSKCGHTSYKIPLCNGLSIGALIKMLSKIACRNCCRKRKLRS